MGCEEDIYSDAQNESRGRGGTGTGGQGRHMSRRALGHRRGMVTLAFEEVLAHPPLAPKADEPLDAKVWRCESVRVVG